MLFLLKTMLTVHLPETYTALTLNKIKETVTACRCRSETRARVPNLRLNAFYPRQDQDPRFFGNFFFIM